MSMPILKLRQVVGFPGNIVGTTGIEVTKANGTVTIETDWNDFGAIDAIPTSPTSFILTFDTASQAYVLVPSHLMGGAVSGIADVTSPGIYGRQTGSWVAVPDFTVVIPDDAPADTRIYGRKDHLWTLVPNPVILDDAVHDSVIYGRKNGAWVAAPSGGGGGVGAGNTRVITANTDVTVANDDGVIAFNQTTPTNVNVLLPAVAGRGGLVLSVEDIKGTAAGHPITIVPNGLEQIDGLASISLANAYGFFAMRPYTGVGWKIINSA